MLNWLYKGLGLRREERGDAYRRRLLRADSPSDIVAGVPTDRVHGLEVVLARCAGASVLDIGCHDGTVPAAFADHGAAFIDGVDLSPVAIDAARTRMAESGADTRFGIADLAAGMPHLRPTLRRSRYDIVCYLGVHQHLRKQLSVERLVEFEAELFALAGQIFVVRTSDRFMDDLHQRLLRAGFHPLTDLIKGAVSPVRSYARSHPKD